MQTVVVRQQRRGRKPPKPVQFVPTPPGAEPARGPSFNLEVSRPGRNAWGRLIGPSDARPSTTAHWISKCQPSQTIRTTTGQQRATSSAGNACADHRAPASPSSGPVDSLVACLGAVQAARFTPLGKAMRDVSGFSAPPIVQSATGRIFWACKNSRQATPGLGVVAESADATSRRTKPGRFLARYQTRCRRRLS
jgi:hypothetical protein